MRNQKATVTQPGCGHHPCSFCDPCYVHESVCYLAYCYVCVWMRARERKKKEREIMETLADSCRVCGWRLEESFITAYGNLDCCTQTFCDFCYDIFILRHIHHQDILLEYLCHLFLFSCMQYAKHLLLKLFFPLTLALIFCGLIPHPLSLSICLSAGQIITETCTSTTDTKCECKPGTFCLPDEPCEVCKKCTR